METLAVTPNKARVTGTIVLNKLDRIISDEDFGVDAEAKLYR